MDISDILMGIGLSQALFIALVTISKPHRHTNDTIMVVWMLFLALPMISKLLRPEYLDCYIPLLSHSLPYPLIYGPLLWIYTDSLTGRSVRVDFKTLKHIAPFIIGSTLQLLFIGHGIWHDNIPVQVPVAYIVIEALTLITSAGYSLATLWLLNKHKSEVLNHFSVLPIQITLKWLKWLTIGFLVALLLPTAIRVFEFSQWFPSYGLTFTVLIFILGVFSIKQSQVFQEQEVEKGTATQEKVSNPKLSFDKSGSSLQATKQAAPTAFETEIQYNKPTLIDEVQLKEPQPISLVNHTREKYERSGLTDEKSHEYLERLKHCMQAEKPYLDANITVEKLAFQVDISKHYLTQIISEQLDKNFYLFINEFRIETIKQLMQDPLNHKETLLSLAYASGFNSKSTFNIAFKRITGMTPSQYRKSITL